MSLGILPRHAQVCPYGIMWFRQMYGYASHHQMISVELELCRGSPAYTPTAHGLVELNHTGSQQSASMARSWWGEEPSSFMSQICLRPVRLL